MKEFLIWFVLAVLTAGGVALIFLLADAIKVDIEIGRRIRALKREAERKART